MNVAQHERLTVLLRQAIGRVEHLLIDEASGRRMCLMARLEAGQVRACPGFIHELSPALLPVRVGVVRVSHDRDEPGTRIGSGAKPIPGQPRLEHGLLRDILRRGRIARQAAGDAMHVGKMHERLALERLATLGEYMFVHGLFDGWHDPSSPPW